MEQGAEQGAEHVLLGGIAQYRATEGRGTADSHTGGAKAPRERIRSSHTHPLSSSCIPSYR